MKEVRIILSPEAEIVYKKLNQEASNSKQSRMILKAINQKKELIKQNIHYGDPIAKNLIPEEYKIKYATTNLFRVELPCFWRMLYTLTNNEQVEIIAFVLDIIPHPDYNKKFGYGKK
ncbi:MAG TPA: hypothetical protein VMZ91_08400 [Candidatus Paceibacterota bacterium]|nr:hypothetical protein [Candidatus Paceibacterota bacterium]